jgi:hypothetical protein
METKLLTFHFTPNAGMENENGNEGHPKNRETKGQKAVFVSLPVPMRICLRMKALNPRHRPSFPVSTYIPRETGNERPNEGSENGNEGKITVPQ